MKFLFRDAHLVVVDKPSGLSVHRGWDPSRDHVVARVRGELRPLIRIASVLDAIERRVRPLQEP